MASWRYAAITGAVLTVFGIGDVGKSGLVGGLLVSVALTVGTVLIVHPLARTIERGRR